MGVDGEETGVLTYGCPSITGKRLLKYGAVIALAFPACIGVDRVGFKGQRKASGKEEHSGLAVRPTAFRWWGLKALGVAVEISDLWVEIILLLFPNMRKLNQKIPEGLISSKILRYKS